VYILIYVIFATPLVANLFYKYGAGRATVAASFVVLLASLDMYYHLPIDGVYYVTGFTWYFIVMVSSVYLASSLYSVRYLAQSDLRFSRSVYYLLLNLFVVSMFFTLVVGNLGLMWVGIEATTVSTVLLVLIEQSDIATEAAWRYMVIVSTGVTFALISVILVYYRLGTLSLRENVGPDLVLSLAVAIGLVGFGTKTGVFPANTWLPDTHSEAPAPISAMFSGVLLPVALYVLYRLFVIDPLRELYSWAAVISLFLASIMMVSQSNFKRLLAYSTIENMNLALLGLVVGQPLGAVLLLIAHAFGKSGAFFSSGALFRLTGSKEIRGYGIWRLRYLPYSLILSTLCVTGAPPFATFVGEFLILSSVLRYSGWQFVIVLAGMGLSFIAVNYHVTKMVFRGEDTLGVEDRLMGVISLAMATVPLVLGIFLLWWLP
jgi:hydrogenase-4 component F